ncbi:hypothetical protein CYMTET_49270 [Cymbomonas tetramitiformis]|uniref:Uncharacterized protein n=1 Tax=Cymbomonas tetramitiformis TaxID=36881 RepID=A0AAE0BQF4_9CHLO|nr:hypothetical protein CYMTET_49270 [Cymbomonas tetramitiformis]
MIPTGCYARGSFSRTTWRSSAGLDLSSFDFDDLTKAVIPKVNELLYDTLAYIVKTDSAAEHFLHLGTDSVSDWDGRRALLDLIKGCVPPGVRQTLQEEHSQLRYPARIDPRPLLAREQRLVRDIRSEDWTPTEMSRKYKLFERLDPDFYAAVAADDGSEAFAAAVAVYGAPAVLAGGESDEIDASTYGFTVPDSGSGVLSELEALTGQVRAMEERAGVHLSQVSLAEDEDVLEHRAPVGAPSANAVASDVPRRVVPRGGGASAGGALATGGYMAQFCVPTEEFPGGVDMVPMRPYVPAMTLEPLISAVTCSFQPAADSFVEPSEAIGHYSIDDYLSDSEADEQATFAVRCSAPWL